ncbi:hypothetical protein PVK06_039431 [Gossypium arboreum]|uniref:Uncharacterized protein n=1 Tax=Gossypium arboreum TaxID=29729 RepID=A0ABR0N4Y4_GOSAR|nr:hypothetical protein PVK06_039431 [Gossypium arboreum]
MSRSRNKEDVAPSDDYGLRWGKSVEAKLGKAMSKLRLHETLHARIAESLFLQPILQVVVEVGKLFRGPSAYELTWVHLEDEYKEIQE